jgi:hypothetical protein
LRNPAARPLTELPIRGQVAFGIPGGSIKFTLKEEPMVVRMKAGALQKAQTLLASGKDIDSVCHEINPEYASWGSHKQQMFQKAMEAVLKSQS